MYVTTFPCHNCAKHIIAAGIKDVYYIEPYPKSKAVEFYTKEISITADEENKVHFLPFSGVGPRRYMDLFAMSSNFFEKRRRKDENGRKLEFDKAKAHPRNLENGLSYLEKELSACIYFDEQVSKQSNLEGASV